MKPMNYFLVIVLAAFVLAACSKKEDQLTTNDSVVTLKAASTAPTANAVAGEIIVKFKNGITETRRSELHIKAHSRIKEKINTKEMEKHGDKEGISLMAVTGDVADAINQLKGQKDVEYVEPNFIYTHQAVSNDPYYTNNSLWGMNGTYGIQAQTAWTAGHTGTNTVYVGVIDEGFMYTHVDLAANAGNTLEIANNKKDDDGNGYIDDTYGWDFTANNNTVYDGINDDHGTHVSGTIAGVGGNGIGVAGVCWNVRLIDAKFLGTTGGTTANAVKAVDYMTNLKTKTGLKIVATNNSLGGGGYSQALYDAISRANAANILFVAAAGNSATNNDVTASYPSNYNLPNVIAVAAITSTGALASFSQYGLTTVDLGAPGNGIISTVPVKSGKNVVSGYASYSGTSMATPHVSGACALYASTHPNATAADIKAAILGSTTATPSLTGKCVTGGRLNVSTY